MDRATQVQIIDEPLCIPHNTNILRKSMHLAMKGTSKADKAY